MESRFSRRATPDAGESACPNHTRSRRADRRNRRLVPGESSLLTRILLRGACPGIRSGPWCLI